MLIVCKLSFPQAQTRVLTDEDIAKLLLALELVWLISHLTKPVVLLALVSAMRRGELMSLRWENVDRPRSVLTRYQKRGFAIGAPFISGGAATDSVAAVYQRCGFSF